MKKIITLLFIVTISVFASNYHGVKYLKNGQNLINHIIIKKFLRRNPKFTKIIQEAIFYSKTEKNKHGTVLCILVSNSIPQQILLHYILNGSILNYYFGTKVIFVTQGFWKKAYIKKFIALRQSINQYQFKKVFAKNMENMIDPYIFTKLKIKQVPVLFFGTYTHDDYYPSDAQLKYMAKGAISIVKFFKLIKNKDSKYDKYYQALRNSY